MGVFPQFAPKLTFAVCMASLAHAWLAGVKIFPESMVEKKRASAKRYNPWLYCSRNLDRAIAKIKHKKGSVMEAYRSVNIGIENGWSKLNSHCPKKGSAKSHKMSWAFCFWAMDFLAARLMVGYNSKRAAMMVAMGVFKYFQRVK